MRVDNTFQFSSGTGQQGQTLLCENIPINDDNIVEGTENFIFDIMSLSEIINVNPQRGSAIIEVLDNDNSECIKLKVKTINSSHFLSP